MIELCDNCEAVGPTTREPRWGRLMVCGRCARFIARNTRTVKPETLARWDEMEAAIARGSDPFPMTPDRVSAFKGLIAELARGESE